MLGYNVFDNRWKYILIPVAITSLLSTGLLLRVPESNMELLYSLPVSESTEAADILAETFEPQRTTYIIVVASDATRGLFNTEAFSKLNDFWNAVNNLHIPDELVQGSEIPGDTTIKNWLVKYSSDQLRIREEGFQPSLRANSLGFVSLNQLCVRDSLNRCINMNPLDIYPGRRQWGSPIRTKDYPNYFAAARNKAFRLNAMFGGIEQVQVGQTTVVSNASSCLFRMDLRSSGYLAVQAAAWEQAVITLVENTNLEGLKMFVRTERSMNDELATSSRLEGTDLVMIVLACTFLSCFTVFMHWSKFPHRSTAIPAFVGILSTLLAYGGGAGLCYLIGFKHVPPCEATPFLVLGIGVDDIFVILNAYSMAYLYSDDPRRRVALTLRDAGVSVTLTTITNVIAFGVGATSPYYSVLVFCVVTTTGLVAGYILCLTVMVGALSVVAHHYAEPEIASTIENGYLGITNREYSQNVEMTKQSPGILKDNLLNNECEAQSPGNPGMKVLTNTLSPAKVSKKEYKHMNSKVELMAEYRGMDCQISDEYCLWKNNDNALQNTMFSAALKDFPNSVQKNKSRKRSRIADGVYYVRRLDNHYVTSVKVNTMEENRRKKKTCNFFKSLCLWRLNSFKLSESSATKSATDLESNGDPVSLADTLPTSRALKSCNAAKGAEIGIEVISPGFLKESSSKTASNECCADPIQPAVSPDGKAASPPVLLDNGTQLLHPNSISLEEPEGNVGACARHIFMNIYGPLLMTPFVKTLVLLAFMCCFLWGLFNTRNLEVGLELPDVTPYKSYLRDFYMVRKHYFSDYGDECEVFFPNAGKLWLPEVQHIVLELDQQVTAAEHVVFVLSGMADFLRQMQADNRLASLDNETTFVTALRSWLDTPRGLATSTLFELDGDKLVAWRFQYWTAYVQNTGLAVQWLKAIRAILSESDAKYGSSVDGVPRGIATTALAIYWESDLRIMAATMSNMGVALIAMALVGAFLLPDFISGLLVLIVIFMIDVFVVSMMPVMGLKVNMLTMVNLVLAIGFAVDYTAHISHCYTHCNGDTRNKRAIEALVLMGLPITSSMLSTYTAIVVLATSQKYILVVVFKMMSVVFIAAFLHGVILMPVLLSLVGPFHESHKDIIQIESGHLTEYVKLNGNSNQLLEYPSSSYDEQKCRFGSLVDGLSSG